VRLRRADRAEKLANPNLAVFADARSLAGKTKRGQNAPLAAIDAVEAATKLPFEEGSEVEWRLFDGCLDSTQAKAMIHGFFAERAVNKIPDVPKDTPVFGIRRAAVVGGGIAMCYATAGIPVILRDSSQEALDRGIATIRRNYSNSVKRGRYSQEEMDRRMALIRPQLTYDGFDDAGIVVEAVFESMAVKKTVIGELNSVIKAECIVATNTSMLSIDEIASAALRPDMVIGHHFFSPANVMRLLEIVRGSETDRRVIATSMALSRKLGKIGVVARNTRGFIGNRMLAPYEREAQFLLEEGASVEDVNDAIYHFGMAMGPMAMNDMASGDINWRIKKEFPDPPGVRERYVVADRLCEMGRYGQKTGRGWSLYDENRKPRPDPEVAALIEQVARERGIGQRRITREEIVDRCIYALVNAGAELLEEGIALCVSDIDTVYLNGYGFPVWRGGPMFYADTVGLANVLSRIREFEARHGSELWRPAPLLERLAETGQTFGDFDRTRELAATA
jgi:3-hydroxyacyl-CoA dehydrogenase